MRVISERSSLFSSAVLFSSSALYDLSSIHVLDNKDVRPHTGATHPDDPLSHFQLVIRFDRFQLFVQASVPVRVVVLSRFEHLLLPVQLVFTSY